MRALITGSRGQVGHQLELTKPAGATILALTRAECDITDREAILAAAQRFAPDVIINAAAYTNVDGAESDKESASRINEKGAAHVADAAVQTGARLIHISTNYVFDGSKSKPYTVTDRPSPLGIYGASKLAGEKAVLASHASAAIVRTGWVYAETGTGFVHKILDRLRAGSALRVVSDQVGTPTSAQDFAQFLWACAERPPQVKLMHWTNSGVTSWYDFAVAIHELASERGIVSRDAEIQPVSSDDYNPPAKRPWYGVLDCYETWKTYGPAPHWRTALADTFDRLAALMPQAQRG